MRTDSTRVGKEAQDEARELIANKYGKEYLPEKSPVYASAKSAQEAHEAIRPTSVMREPDAIRQYLEPDQYKLYKLDLEPVRRQPDEPCRYRPDLGGHQGRRLYLPGNRIDRQVPRVHGSLYGRKIRGRRPHRKMTAAKPCSRRWPKGMFCTLIKLDPKQHFTQPPPRFSEALLVKTLEEKGIGTTEHLRRHHFDDPGPRLCPEDREQVPPHRARRAREQPPRGTISR